MSFEQPSNTEQQIEIPEEIQAFWDVLVHMSENNSTPQEYVAKLEEITKNLAEKDPEFADTMSACKPGDTEFMMDALEEYSKKLTEPESSLQ